MTQRLRLRFGLLSSSRQVGSSKFNTQTKNIKVLLWCSARAVIKTKIAHEERSCVWGEATDKISVKTHLFRTLCFSLWIMCIQTVGPNRSADVHLQTFVTACISLPVVTRSFYHSIKVFNCKWWGDLEGGILDFWFDQAEKAIWEIRLAATFVVVTNNMHVQKRGFCRSKHRSIITY